MRSVQNEFTRNNDIVVFDFEDTYRNLTIKTLTSLHWAVHTFNTSYILKVDDDTFPNVNEILHFLQQRISPTSKVILGHCSGDNPVDRNKTSKYYVGFHDYPLREWPPFCFGTGYVISNLAVHRLLEFTKEPRLYHLEDVSLGLLARKVGNVEILNIDKWKGYSLDGKVHDCPDTYTFHNVGPDVMETMWKNCFMRPGIKIIHKQSNIIEIINSKINILQRSNS